MLFPIVILTKYNNVKQVLTHASCATPYRTIPYLSFIASPLARMDDMCTFFNELSLETGVI